MALVKRAAQDVALMPPPPFKKIKRPTTVLDEDDYTSALSDIIARDYFPGLAEGHAQEEYLAALASNNPAWIAEAGQKLRDVVAGSTPPKPKVRRTERDERYGGQHRNRAPVPDTPRGYTGSETPRSVQSENAEEMASTDYAAKPDTSAFSLSEFQGKYTSEDNESFNTVLDKQNLKKREKHAYLWTSDQRIPTARQIEHRAHELKLLTEKADTEAKIGKELIPLTTGAISTRSAKPDAWKISRPDNNFMFTPSSVDEQGLPTIQEAREAASKAGPKEIVHANTRFPPLQYLDDIDPRSIPPSPSLNTDIIAHRDLFRATRNNTGRPPSDSQTESSFQPSDGSETPRVNGYAFVDEDEPDHQPLKSTHSPSYRDLLAGQVSTSTTNPFKLSNPRRREELHHKLVENNHEKNRKDGNHDTPLTTRREKAGNMTPAARSLMQKLGKTPLAGSGKSVQRKEMWTPVRTPRRSDVLVGAGGGRVVGSGG